MGGFSSVGPTSGQATGVIGGRAPSVRAAVVSEALRSISLDGAVSGDSIVKFGDRFSFVSKRFAGLAPGLYTEAELGPVPAGRIWLVQAVQFIDLGTSGDFLLYIAPAGAPHFEPSLTTQQNFFNVQGIVIQAGTSFPGNFFADVFPRGRPFVIPEGWTIRWAADGLLTTDSASLSALVAELQLSELEPCP